MDSEPNFRIRLLEGEVAVQPVISPTGFEDKVYEADDDSPFTLFLQKDASACDPVGGIRPDAGKMKAEIAPVYLQVFPGAQMIVERQGQHDRIIDLLTSDKRNRINESVSRFIERRVGNGRQSTDIRSVHNKGLTAAYGRLTAATKQKNSKQGQE